MSDGTSDTADKMIALVRRLREDEDAADFHTRLEYAGSDQSLGALFDDTLTGNTEFALLFKLLTTAKSVRSATEGQRLVIPGDPENSLLFKIITNTPEPIISFMADRFTDEDRNIVRAWIESLVEDESDSADDR